MSGRSPKVHARSVWCGSNTITSECSRTGGITLSEDPNEVTCLACLEVLASRVERLLRRTDVS